MQECILNIYNRTTYLLDPLACVFGQPSRFCSFFCWWQRILGWRTKKVSDIK